MARKSKKTVVIFGRSPFINVAKPYIDNIISKYECIGINHFCEKYPKVQHVAFADLIMPELNGQHVISCNANYLALASYKNKDLYDMHFGLEFDERDGHLTMCNHSPSMALNWAWQKGFTRAVLIGVDLVNNVEHFDTKHPFNMPQTMVNESRYQLENLMPQGFEVLQTNPDCTMKLKKIKLEDL